MSPSHYRPEMFSEYLFAHVYDIDTVLQALCSSSSVYLDTRGGLITAQPPADAPAKNIFKLEPLPASFCTEILQSTERKHLSAEENQQLEEWLQTSDITSLPHYFTQGRTGGWLRERVKEAALDWLDANDLIPPSMRHINRKKIAATSVTSKTITIESPDF